MQYKPLLTIAIFVAAVLILTKKDSRHKVYTLFDQIVPGNQAVSASTEDKIWMAIAAGLFAVGLWLQFGKVGYGAYKIQSLLDRFEGESYASEYFDAFDPFESTSNDALYSNL